MPSSFKISDAHMQAFSAQQQKRFEDEMCAYFKAEYPDKYQRAGEPWVRELINHGIEKGRKYDILLEPDVARFLDLMFAISPNIDENEETAWVRPILNQRGLTGEQKLDQIHEHLMFAPRTEPVAPPTKSPPPGRNR